MILILGYFCGIYHRIVDRKEEMKTDCLFQQQTRNLEEGDCQVPLVYEANYFARLGAQRNHRK